MYIGVEFGCQAGLRRSGGRRPDEISRHSDLALKYVLSTGVLETAQNDNEHSNLDARFLRMPRLFTRPRPSSLPRRAGFASGPKDSRHCSNMYLTCSTTDAGHGATRSTVSRESTAAGRATTTGGGGWTSPAYCGCTAQAGPGTQG